MSKEIIAISISTAVFYFIFSSIAILLFPVEQTRDIWDYVMPYINAFRFSVVAMISYLTVGLLLR